MAAAASIALRCGGGKAFLRGEDRMMVGGDRAMQGRCLPPHPTRSCSVATRRWGARAGQQNAAGNVAASTSSVCIGPFGPPRLIGGADHPRRGGGTDRREVVAPEKLDEWMRESVAEIVRNIGEAPFLLHVFSSSSSTGLGLEREAADAESWPHIRRRWATGAALPPDGVILVEELKDGDEEEEATTGASDDDEDASRSDHPVASSSSSSSSTTSTSSSSKTWGVVVQGRGTDSAACYILNTCRVRSSFGFCTHFCLARAKCFGDTADVQLKKAWLLGNKHHYQHQQH